MYRNFGQNRSRFSQDRNNNCSSNRDHDRRNWRDNRPRNDGYGSDSEYRRDNNFRNDNQNRDNSDNSRFQNSNNSSNNNFSSSLGAETSFRHQIIHLMYLQLLELQSSSNIRTCLLVLFSKMFQHLKISKISIKINILYSHKCLLIILIMCLEI